jgi:murein DD-endopeptidase MepM/ murein hydrolase activator NlpD
MRAILAIVGLLLILGGGAWWLKAEGQPPQATLTQKIESLGRRTPIDIDVHAGPPGLRSVVVRLQAGGSSFELLRQDFEALSWRGSLVTDKRLHIEPDLNDLQIPEGAATLEVLAETYAWHILPNHSPVILTLPLNVDISPPIVTLLTTQHNVRLGGMELAVVKLSNDTVYSAVIVDSYTFPTISGYFADPSIALAFFAIPQNLTEDVRPVVVARDAAGNQREVALPVNIKMRKFAERTLNLDDNFLNRKVPELEQLNGLRPVADPLQGYLQINRALRQKNEEKIREITKSSVPEALWSSAFHRQTNAAPLSSFADRRSYSYKGEVVDHQIHLGFDLASLKLAPVEATQNGKVVFAGNLGIYGNTVVLDHGLGLFSLYGHLSTITVKEGDSVVIEQAIGQTGETGLAAGDHLHFSLMLDGVHTDPVEWWDPHWIKDHITPKLTMFPRPAAAAPTKVETPNEQAKP